MKLTPEERKQREIAKWEKEQKKSKLPGYLVYFLRLVHDDQLHRSGGRRHRGAAVL